MYRVNRVVGRKRARVVTSVDLYDGVGHVLSSPRRTADQCLAAVPTGGRNFGRRNVYLALHRGSRFSPQSERTLRSTENVHSA